MFKITRIAFAIVLCAPALTAQRGGRPQRGQQQIEPAPAQKATALDTSMVRKTPDGYVLDFQDIDLRIVLQAIAEAGGLNVTFSNTLPVGRKVTLRIAQPKSKEVALDILKGVAESNGLRVIESTSLIRLEYTAPLTQQAVQQQFAQAQQPRLYTYRLKHASAVTLAPVISNLLLGATGTSGNNGNQALTFTPATPAGRGGGNGAAGNAGGGRGGVNFGVPVQGNAGGNGPLQQLQQLFGGGAAPASVTRIVAEESSNSLLVRATPDDWALLQPLFASVDLRPLQVLIEVTIVQVQRNHNLEVGISGIETRKRAGNSGAVDTTVALPTAASARDFIYQLTGGNGSINYNVALNALQTRGDVKILSLPVIIAQNNKEAVLNVGQRVPFIQSQQTSSLDPTQQTRNIQYLDVGTTLTITPTINPDGYVNMIMKQTNDNATNDVQFDAPIIATRDASTSIFLRNGQTTVIGGLSDNTTDHTTTGLPFLSRIPWIGPLLFGNTVRNDAATELFIFLTPHIITTDDDIDRLRNSLQGNAPLLQDVPISGRIKTDSTGAPIIVPPKPDSTKPPVKRPTPAFR